MMMTSWQCPDDLHHWPLTVTNWWPGWGTRRPPLSLWAQASDAALRMRSAVSDGQALTAKCLHTVSVLKHFFSLPYPRQKEIDSWHLVIILLVVTWLASDTASWLDSAGLRPGCPPDPGTSVNTEYRVSDAVSLSCELLWDDDNVCALRNSSFWEGGTVLLGDQVLKFLSVCLNPSVSSQHSQKKRLTLFYFSLDFIGIT